MLGDTDQAESDSGSGTLGERRPRRWSRLSNRSPDEFGRRQTKGLVTSLSRFSLPKAPAKGSRLDYFSGRRAVAQEIGFLIVLLGVETPRIRRRSNRRVNARR